jgi:hypothetical protein
MLSKALTRSVLYVHPDLGRIYTPQDFVRAVSMPGQPARLPRAGEFGLVVAVQKRPVVRGDGLLERMRMVWWDITHNERVDQGAVRQDLALFGSTSMAFTAVAVASASLTKTKTDLSLGTASANATTNEFTTLGLSRAAGSLGAYTAPSALGNQFSRVISKTFTASGSATAFGGGLFDSTTVSGSNLYVEDNFGSNAVLVNGDTLNEAWTISN